MLVVIGEDGRLLHSKLEEPEHEDDIFHNARINNIGKQGVKGWVEGMMLTVNE
jgi:hypothetical protein